MSGPSEPQRHAAETEHRAGLGEPLQLGPRVLRNRLVAAPMERNYCTTTGTVTRQYVDYLSRRAAGGAALVFSEASYVRADGKGRRRQLAVDSDACVDGLAEMASAVQRQHALFGVELNHGGRTTSSRVSGFRPVAPSPVPYPLDSPELPIELDRADIHHLIRCYADATRRCRAAGVDVISLHAAHGYLVHQFLSPLTNMRTDEFADPLRFLNLVLEAIRRHAGDMAVGMRISAFDGVPGGLGPSDTIELIRTARVDLLDFLDVSAGSYEAPEWMVQPDDVERGVLAPYSARYRQLGLPVGVAGRVSDADTAANIVARGDADWISLARAIHADPEFPNRVLDRQRYRPCIACNVCIDRLGTGEPVPCSVNPRVVGDELQPDVGTLADGVRILIVGAGPAGLETARGLAEHGAHVEVLEGEERIGGQFALAATLVGHPDYRRLIDWYRAELEGLGVAVRTGVEIDPRSVATPNPDVIVLATGSVGTPRPLPSGETRGIEIRDWLRSGAPTPRACTVWGADREGVGLAHHLARGGCEVLIVGSQQTLAPEVGRRSKAVKVAWLRSQANIRIMLNARVDDVRGDRIHVTTPDTSAWLPSPGPLLLSHGVVPDRRLYEEWVPALPPRFGTHLVGDAGDRGGSVERVISDAARLVDDLYARIRDAGVGKRSQLGEQ